MDLMTALGHGEKNSQRAYVIRIDPESCRKRAVPALTFSANCGQRKLSRCHHTGSVRNESGIPTPTISVSSGGSSS